jgi:putative phosphoesterase
MIGIISDTHDNVANVLKAVELFRQRKVDFVLHLGDVVAPGTIRFFEGVRLKLVRGNCDGDLEGHRRFLEKIGGEYLGTQAVFELDGRRFAAVHGNNTQRLESLIASGKYDYVLHGHTHAKRDETLGRTRVINPGAHYWGAGNTVALLDPAKGRLEFVTLEQ